jgi:hypothetical protein
MKTLAALLLGLALPACASDHLDTPSVIADPRMDIGDLYAWTSSDGRRLNLVMTIVGHSFSSDAEYRFHVDSGKRHGRTTATTDIVCTFASMNAADCRVGTADRIAGDPSSPSGLVGRKGRSRLFAGLRDDPFFNNVKGSRDAFVYAAGELRAGVKLDEAGCPLFDKAQSAEIQRRWANSGQDFLAGWTPASIVLSVDLDVVNRGGKLLAVWGDVASNGRRIDRAARPMTGNALLAPLAADEISDSLKEQYNAATPLDAARFAPEIEKSLALYDGYEGRCGNQMLGQAGARRYRALAAMLADDRLWVDSASARCTQLFGVERAVAGDCGGRAPGYDSANVFRSLLATGETIGIEDGVHRDAQSHSDTAFPFLAAPVKDKP